MFLFTLTVAIIFHTDFSDEMQLVFFLKDLSNRWGIYDYLCLRIQQI